MTDCLWNKNRIMYSIMRCSIFQHDLVMLLHYLVKCKTWSLRAVLSGTALMAWRTLAKQLLNVKACEEYCIRRATMLEVFRDLLVVTIMAPKVLSPCWSVWFSVQNIAAVHLTCAFWRAALTRVHEIFSAHAPVAIDCELDQYSKIFIDTATASWLLNS